MRVRTATVLLIVMALYYIINAASMVFIDDFVKPQSISVYLLIGTLITGFATLAITVDIPD
jgi:hypothetical protein